MYLQSKKFYLGTKNLYGSERVLTAIICLGEALGLENRALALKPRSWSLVKLVPLSWNHFLSLKLSRTEIIQNALWSTCGKFYANPVAAFSQKNTFWLAQASGFPNICKLWDSSAYSHWPLLFWFSNEISILATRSGTFTGDRCGVLRKLLWCFGWGISIIFLIHLLLSKMHEWKIALPVLNKKKKIPRLDYPAVIAT